MTLKQFLKGFLWLIVWGVSIGAGRAQPLNLVLPTDNDALLRGDGSAFYQYVDRTHNGRQMQVWEGGQYGFVRNIRKTPYGEVFTRFHEGVDIRPLYRRDDGEPLDTIRTIDNGKVVYTNRLPKKSNYGNYVVVEHWWSGVPFYSLYAHLSEVHVRTGQKVRQGDRLGRMGYTGAGINRTRAHVHFEINMLLNRDFQVWYNDYFLPRDPNEHGIYNGMNLVGLDVPALYLALQQDSTLTIRDFVMRQPVFYTLRLPANGKVPDWLQRYPWLSNQLVTWLSFQQYIIYARRDQVPRLPEPVTTWEIHFTQSGFPVAIEPIPEPVAGPVVTVMQPSPISYSYLTSGLVEGQRDAAVLSTQGLRYLDLLLRQSPRWSSP